MIRPTSRPASSPASRVACRWPSFKEAGTVITAQEPPLGIEADDRGEDRIAGLLQDDGLPVAYDGDLAVGRPQIDPDDGVHGLFSDQFASCQTGPGPSSPASCHTSPSTGSESSPP